MNLRRILFALLVFAVAAPVAMWLRQLPPPPVKPATAVAGRFVAQDSGTTVLDRITGLHWQQGYSGSTMNWADAKTWCSNNSPALAGSGWRLPSYGELRQLADHQTSSPAIDAVFAGTPSAYFWANTPWVSGGAAWYVSFSSGSSGSDGTAGPSRVRCVR